MALFFFTKEELLEFKVKYDIMTCDITVEEG